MKPASHCAAHSSQRRVLLLAALALSGGSALAQAYPSKPITLIVPWPAGGSTDRHLRALAEIASKHLGQQVVVENRPGGGGTLGPGTMALTAKPDGYTIAQFPMGMLRIPHMQKTQWNPLADFSYIIGVSGYTFGFVVRADSPYKTFNDYIEAARKQPGKIDYGSTGIGTSPHLAVEEFAQRAGIKLTHVPFKGNADNMQAILGGHTMAASDATGWGPMVESGKLRLLATYGSKRTKRWPNVPTLDELGYKTVSDSPFGVCGPKGMDAAVTRTLHDAFRKTLEDPAVLATFDKFDQTVIYMNTDDYTRFAREAFAAEKATIERLGMAMKT